MDMPSLTGGETPKTGETPAVEYTALAASSLISGDVKLTVGEDGLGVTSLFDAVEVLYADMTAIESANYTVTIRTEFGDFVFSRMGSWCEPFYNALVDAYNKKVRKALFVQGDSVLAARGEYRYIEDDCAIHGAAPVEVYENCVCILPPDLGARRVSLCFLTGMEKGDYELTLRMDASTCYTLSKLGYDTVPFRDAIEKQIRKLREKALAAVKELDPSLTAAQASAITRIMPEGTAAPMGRLYAIAPSFITTIESKLNASRAADAYKAFKELCDSAKIYVGFKKNTARGNRDESANMADGLPDISGRPVEGGNPLAALGGMLGENSQEEMTAPDPYMLWLIAPSPDGSACAVEFASGSGDAAATFIYRCEGGYDAFAGQLNRALEAMDFKRKVIRLTGEELLRREHQDYRMALQRNASLQFVRACFIGRVIHTGSWRGKLQELWSGMTSPPAEAAGKYICAACGAQSTHDTKFCEICGARNEAAVPDE